MAVGCSDWQVSSEAIWVLLCYVEYVHGACSLQGSPSSKDGGLELEWRVANAAERSKIWYRGRLWVRAPIAGLAG